MLADLLRAHRSKLRTRWRRLGIYMSTRDDGITLMSTLVNFGALSAFLLLHVSVVVHYLIRRRSTDYWRHLAVHVIGFAILLFVCDQRAGGGPDFGLRVVGDRDRGDGRAPGHRPSPGAGDRARARRLTTQRAVPRQIERRARDLVGEQNPEARLSGSLLQKNVLNRRRWATRQDLGLAIITWIGTAVIGSVW
jgi:hypothetical protein